MSEALDCDVVIVGAGVAGLAAATSLRRAGLEVCCLEARERIGGRILTVHDPHTLHPVELGAEFVHGCSPDVWDIIRSAGLLSYELTSPMVRLARGKVIDDPGTWKSADRILDQMAKAAKKKDESFDSYLSRSRAPAAAKQRARQYVEGFNAARSDEVSTRFLVKESAASDEIDGDRSFRILDGYDAVPRALLERIPDHINVVRLHSVVEQIAWRQGAAEVTHRFGPDRESNVLKARAVLVTVPLGVLQEQPPAPGAIRFEPEPARNLAAARALRFGQVYRVTFRFPHAFLEDDESLRNASFLFSDEKRFPTWWTTHPVISPLLTAWMAGSAAEAFTTSDPAKIADEALSSLKRMLKRNIPEPEQFYFHDWRHDPWSRGGYSYVPVGAVPARKALARPESDTLFFAGEACDFEGHDGTVHGAIGSGMRAARLIEAAMRHTAK